MKRLSHVIGTDLRLNETCQIGNTNIAILEEIRERVLSTVRRCLTSTNRSLNPNIPGCRFTRPGGASLGLAFCLGRLNGSAAWFGGGLILTIDHTMDRDSQVSGQGRPNYSLTAPHVKQDVVATATWIDLGGGASKICLEM